MHFPTPLIITAILLFHLPAARAGEIGSWLDDNVAGLFDIYRDLHSHPEVSYAEQRTAGQMADLLSEAGLTVTPNVGGFGVVAVVENGEGPTLMIRCDMDALPVTEQTPLPFASTATVQTADGSTSGVMHACGHDIHMTSAIGTTRYLMANRNDWSGTLMVIAQPAEETGGGAAKMLEAGLFDRFPRPDAAIALHVSSDTPAGKIKVLPGFACANVDSVDITMNGRGGHGSAPHTTIDPVLMAAELVISLQTIVSRTVRPLDPAVVTVGSIHGGTKHNIIGDTCKLQLTVRTYDAAVRQTVLASIRRKASAVAAGHDAPEPTVTTSEGTPAMKNDFDLTERLRPVWDMALGTDNVLDDEPSMGGEDFSRYGLAGVPIVMFRLGSVESSRLERFKSLAVPPPSLHSGQYYPDFEPTIRTGITATTAAALEMLKR